MLGHFHRERERERLSHNLSFKIPVCLPLCLPFTTWHSSPPVLSLSTALLLWRHPLNPSPTPPTHTQTYLPLLHPMHMFSDEWGSVCPWMQIWLKFKFRQGRERRQWHMICVMCHCLLDVTEYHAVLAGLVWTSSPDWYFISCCSFHDGISHQHKALIYLLTHRLCSKQS